MDSWIFYQNVNFDDLTVKSYHVDTRDFFCSEGGGVPDINLHKARNRSEEYYHTNAEIKALLNRFYEESGGTASWRMFSLSGEAEFRTSGWQLKYIRIFRLQGGLVVYDREAKFLFSKHMLACPVAENYLNRIK